MQEVPHTEPPSPLLRVELSFTPLRLWGVAAGTLLSGILISLLFSRLAGEERSFTVLVAGSAVWLVATLLVLAIALEMIVRRHRGAARLNRELIALHQAALVVHGEQDLNVRLERIVEEARTLLATRYGALSVLDDDNHILSFITTGISPEERAKIGPPPQGRGLLGVPLHDGQALRVDNLQKHPRSAGFPAGHPPMHSLLAVPILCTGKFKGNLYLSEKRDGAEFTAEEEATLKRFATTAALAVDNAELNRGLRSLAVTEERMRIAREMHDGMAQVLAYVNTKAQAVSEFLGTGNVDDARDQLEQLAAAAREVYADAREGILSLRSSADPQQGLAETLAQYVAQWREMARIEATLEADPDVQLEPDQELQLVRIVQEALANVRKHSSARKAEIFLSRADSEILLVITDNGMGFDPNRPRVGDQPRFGLATMRERAAEVGGTLDVIATPGQGTRVQVRLPAPAAR